MSASALLVVSLVAVAAVRAPAQTPASTSPFAVIEGVAVDSLHADYLRGAVIMVEGLNLTATTDFRGRFRLDSIPPGTHRISLSHPVLDTIGISLVTPPLQLSAGQLVRVDLATPSPKSVVLMRCTAPERLIGTHALFGTVQYAETDAPAAGAKVMLEWMEYEGGSSLQTRPRRRVATVADNGHFKICGLPGELTGTLIAARGADTTAALMVHLNTVASTAGLELAEPDDADASAVPAGGAPAPATSRPAAQRRRGVLTGRILDKAGVPLSRVRVSIDGDTAFAMSGSDGRFTLRNVRPGTRSVTARRLGFVPADEVVAIHSANPTEVTVMLGDFVPVLDTVQIRAPAVQIGLEKVGFTKRKTTSSGYFLSPSDIESRNALDLPGLLATAPMLRRVTIAGGTQVLTGRPQSGSNGCLNYFVDGVPWTGGGIEDFIRPSEIAAVEVYSTGFTPGQFMSAIAQCETVVIWTKTKVGVR